MPDPDPRVCLAGGDHDWQDRTSALACGRRGQSWRLTSARCPRCNTIRSVVDGPDGRSVQDTPA